MPDTPDLPRPSQLWKHLQPDRKLQAAEAFWRFHVEGGAARALQHLGPKTIIDLLA